MKIAYFDCFSGASGDMILASLIDAGVPFNRFNSFLRRLTPKHNLSIRHLHTEKCGLHSSKIEIKGAEKHLSYAQILSHIKQAQIDNRIKSDSLRILDRLVKAEAKVHHHQKQNIKLHELGSVDTLIDVVGSVWGLDYFGIKAIYISSLPLNKGIISTHHGCYPVPAPATMELIKGFPVVPSNIKAELLTPTGAAILTTLSKPARLMPLFTISKIGYGAGHMDIVDRPNVLRLLIGKTDDDLDSLETDPVCVMETNIDNISAEVIGYTVERLFESGALDVFTIPIRMKKFRPGVLLQVICPLNLIQSLEEVIFTEIPTLGIRKYLTSRIKLKRGFAYSKTKYGNIKIKTSQYHNKIVNSMPEYEDCRKAARRHNVPLRYVIKEAQKSI